MTREVYLDNSATTRISESALSIYCELSREHYGNPSSLHHRGVDAEKYLTRTREILCRALGSVGTVIFTGSGSEANNLAIFGRAHAKPRFARGRIITTAGEHASVSAPLARLREEGFTVVEIPTLGGRLDMDALYASLTKDTVLVTMMLVNNETGATYDLQSVSAAVKRACPDAVFHCDATQAFLKFPFSVRHMGVDMVTLSAHKVEGPKGVGALWVSDAVIKNKGLLPLILGGGQEKGMRSGTENLPAIAAFGQAVEDGVKTLGAREEKMRALRERLLGALNTDEFADVKPLITPEPAPHILNVALPSIKSEVMLHYLSSKGICISSGSACSSHGRHGAHPLISYGRSEREADSSIRISFSADNEEEDVDIFCRELLSGLRTLARMR